MNKTNKEKKKVVKKCKCGHGHGYHYISDVEISLGQVFCAKDNCYGWQQCNLDRSLIDVSKKPKH